ncbi:MAG: hypothetical protein AAF640_00210 [Pseudomonadota bacterium]
MDLSAEKDADIGREVFLRLHRLAERLAKRHGIGADRAGDFIILGSLFLTADLNDCDLTKALSVAQELVCSVAEDTPSWDTRH